MENKYRVFEKAVRLCNSLLNACILLILACVVGYCGFVLWDTYMVGLEASNQVYEKYKPSLENTLSFEDLQAINPEVVGWLELEGTNIDYPITQGEDNLKYVNMSAEGEYSLSGSLFLDYRNSLSPVDPVSIVYGHDMVDDKMFGGLVRYKSIEYAEKHSMGSLYLGGEFYTLSVMAFLETDAYDTSVYNAGVSRGDLDAYYNKILERSVTTLPVNFDARKDSLLLLSTCSSEETNGRDVVICIVER